MTEPTGDCCALPRPKLCERCAYDEVDLDAGVPDIWTDRFQALCAECARKGYLLQARRMEVD